MIKQFFQKESTRFRWQALNKATNEQIEHNYHAKAFDVELSYGEYVVSAKVEGYDFKLAVVNNNTVTLNDYSPSGIENAIFIFTKKKTEDEKPKPSEPKKEEPKQSGVVPYVPSLPVPSITEKTDKMESHKSETKTEEVKKTAEEGKQEEQPKPVENIKSEPAQNREKKDFQVSKLKMTVIKNKISDKFKKLFTKVAYKVKFADGESDENKKKVKVKLPYKKYVKGYNFYVFDIATGKRYKAKYDKKRKELVFKTDKSGDYAVLKEKVKNK